MNYCNNRWASIDILKYSGNEDDLDLVIDDSNETNDVQVIRDWDNAVFKIVVTNYWDENIKNIQIEDAKASACETDGYVNLKTRRFLNEDWNSVTIKWNIDSDGNLEPWEYFWYTCEKKLSGNTYKNTAKVKGEKGWWTVDDQDDTKVVKLSCNPNWILDEDSEVCDPKDDWWADDDDGVGNKEKWWKEWCSYECLPIDEPTNTTCSNIYIENDYTNDDHLDTWITCYWNSEVKSFMLDCGDGSNKMFVDAEDYAGAKKWVFEDSKKCSYNSGDWSTFKAKCSVSEKSNNTDPEDSSWKTSLDCQDTVTIWSWEPTIDCKDLKALGWKWANLVCTPQTYPWWWTWTEPTFANNSDTKMVCLQVSDEYGNDIDLSYFDFMAWSSKAGFSGNWDYEDNIWAEFLINGLNINQVDSNSWYVEWVEILEAAMIQSHICVLMKSVVPWKKTFDFELSIPRHTETYPLMWNWDYRVISWESSMEIEFEKPFVWQFKVTDETWWSSELWRSVPKINTYQQYQVLPILQKACRPNDDCRYSDWYLNIKLSKNWWSSNQNATADDTVINVTDKHKFWEFDGIDNSLGDCKNGQQEENSICWNFLWWFYARIDATTDEAALETPIVQSQKMTISYELGWKRVKYYITRESKWDDDTEFNLEGLPDIQSLWLKVIWTAQWKGKWWSTGQDDNFSDISELEQRAAIKANAHEIINWMTPWWNPVNWVKYVKDENYEIDPDSQEIDFETLVVENGNVTIASNIDWDSIWIIVINTNYDYSKYESWDKKWTYKYWNVFINSDVTEINAMIYADGWIISSDTNWKPWVKNTVTRTADLQEQLWLNWAVFTRNTVGWALAWESWEYKLPGWEVITDFEEAMIYDLNYTRSNSSWSVVGYEDYPFIIEFDSDLQSNPPKGFSE